LDNEEKKKPKKRKNHLNSEHGDAKRFKSTSPAKDCNDAIKNIFLLSNFGVTDNNSCDNNKINSKNNKNKNKSIGIDITVDSETNEDIGMPLNEN